MTTKIEGTFVLDGLIEGRLTADAGVPARLQDWVALMRRLGLDLQLELDGGAFSLLANASTVPVSRLGAEPARQVREAVAQLAASFPDPAAAELFSTLRSIEIQPGREVQTVYVIRPDGSVDAPERVIDARTAPPPVPPSTRDWVKVGAVSLVLLAALFGVTSLFVDWGGTVESLWHEVVPFDADAVVVESRYERFFRVTARERARGGKALVLELERTDSFPRDETAILEARENTGRMSTGRRLALDALARGYVRAEIFGADGAFLGFTEVRVAKLREEPKIRVEIAVLRDPRPARIVLTW